METVMKKTKDAKRLLFSSERIRDLRPEELRGARGGVCTVSNVGEPTGGGGGGGGCVNATCGINGDTNACTASLTGQRK
jgi:hypothetical protein